ncbi:MAG: sel1 repeat family protein [Candidatus Obscuribacter sp.]|nr:sel1 repeat family protein [Candidatus Obscuribacter sp.]MBP6348353.1 sel1 repeat family protein [Candidatus Obscuribacter sp.]MBP6594523.1 sel1 repeat family protein [Candidatus Obscuribacter sp.]MBP7577093.1 sel1 repeat family protein [Candidatus Obscuribacter sp.]
MKIAIQVLLIVGFILAVVLVAYSNISSSNTAPLDMLEKDNLAKQMLAFRKDFDIPVEPGENTSFDLSQYGAFETHLTKEQLKTCVDKIGLQKVEGELEPEERALVDLLPSLAASYQNEEVGIDAYRGKSLKKDKIPFEYILMFNKPATGETCFFLTYQNLLLGTDQASITQAAAQEPLPEALYQKAKQGDAEAQYRIASIFAQEDGIARARLAKSWYLKAAQQGHAEAQYRLGKLYSSGDLGKPDNLEAQKWLNLAIKNGSTPAKLVLGQLVATNAVKGDIDSYLLARAKKDDTHAQLVLAMNYLKQKKNEEQAIYWLKQAASHGDFAPLLELAKIYEQKPGEKNKQEALHWYKAAADLDSHDALMKLGDLSYKDQKYREACDYYRRSIMRDHLAIGHSKHRASPQRACADGDALAKAGKLAEAAKVYKAIAIKRKAEE